MVHQRAHAYKQIENRPSSLSRPVKGVSLYRPIAGAPGVDAIAVSYGLLRQVFDKDDIRYSAVTVWVMEIV